MGGVHPDSVETLTPDRRETSHAGPARMRRRMPVVSVAGVAVAALALLPLGYLLVRSSELGWERVFEIAFSDRTRGLLWRSEEPTSELQSLMRISYAVFCLKKKIHRHQIDNEQEQSKNRRK